jgi:CheY-like chemotaxis protein
LRGSIQKTTDAAQDDTESTRCRVIVVDDHPASAEMLAEVLRMEGYSASVAHSGQEALAVAREFKPAIALLDIGLPDMNGFALAGLFKAAPELQHIRLVALSGYAQPSDPSGSQPGGFEHYLIKPVEIEALLSVLARLAI